MNAWTVGVDEPPKYGLQKHGTRKQEAANKKRKSQSVVWVFEV